MRLLLGERCKWLLVGMLLMAGCGRESIAVSVPNHCLIKEELFFSCIMQNGKILSLCGGADGNSVVYRYGRKNSMELVYPDGELTGESKFKYNKYFRYGAEYYRVAFIRGRHHYEVFRDTDTDGSSGPRAGVIVKWNSAAGEKEVTMSCTDRIEDGLNKLSGKLECDMESALGCAD